MRDLGLAKGSRAWLLGGALAVALAATGPARADQIVVSDYGAVGVTGWAVRIAMAKGFFKQAGADIDGIVSSNGGGDTVRNLVAGDLPYATGGVQSVVDAVQGGADLKIIEQTESTNASIAWVVMPDSPIRNVRTDLKGKRMGYTSPRSTSQAIEMALMSRLGYAPSDVTLVSTNGFGPGFVLLERGGIDIMPMTEPNYTLSKGKYRAVLWENDSTLFPAYGDGIGYTTAKAAHDKPALLRAIIAGRRMAVDWMATHRDEAAQIIASSAKFDEAGIRTVLDNMIDHGAVDGVPTIGTGGFNMQSLQNALALSRTFRTDASTVDVTRLVDEEFLPDDLKTRK